MSSPGAAQNTTTALQVLAFWAPRSSLTYGKSHYEILCYFQSGGNSGKERQTDTKAAGQAELQGPFCVTAAALWRRRQSSLGLFLPLECADNPNEGQAVPPIPGLFPSPFHIRLQFKERPNRGKGERGRAWVTHHARDPRHLKAHQKSEQGAPLTRELVSVARCNASVTSTCVGGSLEAWITWVREKGSVTASSRGPQAAQPSVLDRTNRTNSRNPRKSLAECTAHASLQKSSSRPV